MGVGGGGSQRVTGVRRVSLGIKLTDEGDAPSDPVTLGLIAGNAHADHKVRRVTGSGQGTATFTGLVHRYQVERRLRQVGSLARFHPNLCGGGG